MLEEVPALPVPLASEVGWASKSGRGVGEVENIYGAELMGKLEGLGVCGLVGSSGMIGVWW